MLENDLIVSDISFINPDTLYTGKPYIPAFPRKMHALAYITFEKSRDSYRYRRLAPVIEYLNLHCLEPGFTQESLPTFAEMSMVSLNRLFKEFFGTTVHGYINEKRIGEAKSLLVNSTNTISEIAQACGYADIYTFSHAFHRNTGISPTEWRSR